MFCEVLDLAFLDFVLRDCFLCFSCVFIVANFQKVNYILKM